MKHFNFFANGSVSTPPCSSHKFNRFLSFCFLAVTLMVSANAWGEHSFHGDLWMNQSGWSGGPQFVQVDGKEQLKIVMPNMKIRFEFYSGSTVKKVQDYWQSEGSNMTNTKSGTDTKSVFNALGGTKLVTYEYKNSKLTANYSDYPKQYAGWKLYIDNNLVEGTTDVNGSITTSVSAGTHTFYFTDGTTPTYQGVNWFGGLYINTSESSGVTFNNLQYYKTDAVGTFTAPISDVKGKDGNANYYMFGDGRFTLNESSNLTFTFDGGKITIKKSVAPTPTVYYDVTFNSNGGSSVAKQSVGEGLTVTKPADPTKQNKGFAGWYSDEQLQNKYDFSTPVTKEMTLYAKWADPFAQNEEIYLYLNGNTSWPSSNAVIAAIFFQVDNPEYCLETQNTTYGDANIENVNLSQPQLGRKYHTLTKINNNWYSIKVPYANAGGIRFVRMSGENQDYMWGWAYSQYVGEQDGRHSIKFTNTQDKKTTTEWYNETPCWTVTFDMMGHGEAIASKQVIKGEKVDKPTNPSADGWKFINWYEENTLSNVYDFNSAVNSNMTLYAKWEQLEMVTVTFNADGGQPVPVNQEIEKGGKATKPATDPAKAGYNFTGWDWNFDNTIDADKTINAQYTLKGVESVTLDKATLKLVENGATGTIAISTILPSDVLSMTTTWSSDNTGVATVNNGVVTPVAKGTATITCTVANATASKSAFCVVTVKGEDEDCEMILTPIYNYIIGSTPTGGTGATDKLFDPSKQSEPATIRIIKFKFNNVNSKCSGDPWMADIDGVVKGMPAATDGSDEWYEIPAGTGNYSTTLYYLQNVKSECYLYRGINKKSMGAWTAYLPSTSATNANTDEYKWCYLDDGNKHLACYEGYTGSVGSTGENNGAYIMHNRNWEDQNTWSNCPIPALVCGRYDNGNLGSWTSRYAELKVVDNSAPNPNYKQSPIEQDSKSYYRFAEGATMTATSNTALRPGDVVTVYCYNPSGATVTGTLTIGTENTTISLTAGQKLAFEYTITAKGATTAVVASNSEDFCVAGIEIARELPDTYKEPNLVWDTDLSGGVTQSVEAGAFTHTASSKSAGEITYSSSVPAVAIVNATTGEVTPVAAGTTVITATIEQAGCYAEGTASYTVTLTDLPKPEITFVTLPDGALPQGLANQTIVVTTTGGDNFNLAITEGEGATLDITENTGSQITATLSMGANATNIELTASTDRTATLAQNAVTANVAVSACIPEGANIFEFTLTGSDAATGQVAGGVLGGTVDQTALGTVGTEDNPATARLVKIAFNSQNMTDVDATLQGTTGKTDSSDQWYEIPTNSKSSTNEALYYYKNKATGAYMYKYKDGGMLGPNGGWKYYKILTSTINAKNDLYKWFLRTKGSGDNTLRMLNADNYNGNISGSHCIRLLHTEVDNSWKEPYMGASLSGEQGNSEFTPVVTVVDAAAANPDMLKSVEHNDKTYYIISSEGSITLRGDFKAGDVVKVDTYDRKNDKAEVKEYEIQAAASSYTYTTSNEYVCVNNIKVWRNQVGEMINPTLTFAESNVTMDVKQSQTTYTQVATPSVVTVNAITYTTDNDAATVDANGQVTLVNASSIKHGTIITITATMPAVGCYNKATASYTIRVKNITPDALQTMIDETEVGGALELIDNYSGCDATISKAISINANGNTIGNLTIALTGDLTLTGAMTANNLYLAADQAGHKSGQLKGADKLTLEGTAYMDLSFANAQTPLSAGWYAFTVPFKVSSTQGIYNVEEGSVTKLVNETQYAIMNYQGDVRAQGKYGWIKTSKVGGILLPGTLYIIAFGNSEYDKIRFVKASGDLNTNTVNVYKYASGTTTDAGWNGVGNPTLAYGNATNTGGAEHAQFLDHEGNAFIASEESITNQTYIVSSAFFIQANSDDVMTFAAPSTNGNLYAPRRAAAEGNSEFMVEISQNGKTHDRIFLSANDEASATYEIGHDLIKLGAVDGAAKVAQVAINGYNMSLCDAEFAFDSNNEAIFPLTITAPKTGAYTLDVKRVCEGQTITLLQNGQPIVMQNGQIDLDLVKGTTTDYSLVIGRTKSDVVTGNGQVVLPAGVSKILLHNHLYIIKDNKVFGTLGESVNR